MKSKIKQRIIVYHLHNINILFKVCYGRCNYFVNYNLKESPNRLVKRYNLNTTQHYNN